MTVLEQESFDGLSDGATIGTGNTSFDTVTGTSLDATTSAIHGTGALDISVGSSNHTCQWTTSVSGRTLLHARVYMRITGTVGNEAWIFGCGNAAGSVAVIVMLETSGSIAIKQSNESGNTQSSTQTFGASDELRVEWELDLDNDTQTAELFYGANIEGTTADETLTTSASMADMANWQIGRVLNRDTPVVADELAIGDAPIGPVGTGGQDITPAAQTVDATPGTLTLGIGVDPAAVTVDATAGTLSMAIGVTPGAVSIDATPGTVTVAPGAVDITPDPVTVTATPGTVTVSSGAIDITPGAVTIDVAPGTTTVDLDMPLDGPTIEATPGTLAVTTGAVDITPDALTVAVAPGSLSVAVVTDDPNPFKLSHTEPAGITHRETFAITYQEPPA